MTTTASTLPIDSTFDTRADIRPAGGNQMQKQKHFKAALIDLYNGEANLGIQSIKNLVRNWSHPELQPTVSLDQFETRKDDIAPGLDYDLYISSGGPGSPFDGEGTAWEAAYFNWLDAIWRHNQSTAVKSGEASPKHVLFICHSFQMMCRHFALGKVTRRKSKSFGVLKTHPTEAGLRDPLFKGLGNPFYVADFRDWQVVQPNHRRIASLGASILAIEKKRPHVPLERAVMGIRLSREMMGVQFHPEANPEGMLIHFQKEDQKKIVIRHHGEQKFQQIIKRLEDPNFLLRTYNTVIPNFLKKATGH